MDSLKDSLITVFALCVLLTSLVGVIMLTSNAVASYQCDNYQKMTGKLTEYVFFDSCYIKTGDGWQRWDEYKARAFTNEGVRK